MNKKEIYYFKASGKMVSRLFVTHKLFHAVSADLSLSEYLTDVYSFFPMLALYHWVHC